MAEFMPKAAFLGLDEQFPRLVVQVGGTQSRSGGRNQPNEARLVCPRDELNPRAGFPLPHNTLGLRAVRLELGVGNEGHLSPRPGREFGRGQALFRPAAPASRRLPSPQLLNRSEVDVSAEDSTTVPNLNRDGFPGLQMGVPDRYVFGRRATSEEKKG